MLNNMLLRLLGIPNTVIDGPAIQCEVAAFCMVRMGVRANIHLGGQTQFCPNGERKLFVTRLRQGEKNNTELLQSLFFDGR